MEDPGRTTRDLVLTLVNNDRKTFPCSLRPAVDSRLGSDWSHDTPAFLLGEGHNGISVVMAIKELKVEGGVREALVKGRQ